ncbi:MAG: holo-ACP synthase [Syntrophomonadaceae bacterium]
MVGVDLVDVKRLQRVVDRTPRILHRVFTEQELHYCFSQKNPYPSLAARFAAKEAVKKLIPACAARICFKNTEIVRDAYGGPQIVLHGNTRELFRQNSITALTVSLSHTEYQAIAVVTAVKGSDGDENSQCPGNEDNRQ